MLAAYAIPNKSATAKLALFPSKREFCKTANTTGISIRVVAVLETHILKEADASINPKTKVFGLWPPNNRIIDIAIRL